MEAWPGWFLVGKKHLVNSEQLERHKQQVPHMTPVDCQVCEHFYVIQTCLPDLE